MDYKQKYLKYKLKYLTLKKQLGSGYCACQHECGCNREKRIKEIQECLRNKNTSGDVTFGFDEVMCNNPNTQKSINMPSDDIIKANYMIIQKSTSVFGDIKICWFCNHFMDSHKSLCKTQNCEEECTRYNNEVGQTGPCLNCGHRFDEHEKSNQLGLCDE